MTFGTSIQERAGPMGTGQRRPSRSPRSQRSRSADVDCLKKYTERRGEERRNTEVPDTSKIDSSRWIPLAKNISRIQPSTKSKSPQPSRDEEKRRSVVPVETNEEPTTDNGKLCSNLPKNISPSRDEEAKINDAKNETRPNAAAYRSNAGRSQSTDVSNVKSEKRAEERRHTEVGDPRAIATRWIPQINTSRFRYDASPFARISNSCEITKNAAARWMAFVKNQSACSTPRAEAEKVSVAVEASRKAEAQQTKDPKKETPKWEPHRKFSAGKSNRDGHQQQDDAEVRKDLLSPESSEQTNKLSQRMRDLYDFKTENEWPQRATKPRRENTWISKSSSEEEKNNHPVRRNSQDLEFNERISSIKLKDLKTRFDNHQENKRKPLDPETVKAFNEECEERLRKFNERLRFSEDLGTAKPRMKERRTYSDDCDEKARRDSRSAHKDVQEETRISCEKKRTSDASSKSRGSYAEINPVKRDSRTSDASYASIGKQSAKRGSVECKSTRPMCALPPRRAFSQTEERPATPVPPVEWNDDRYVAMKLMTERQKRDSTRYKVYLT